ncbi:lysyl-tRNA synthetase [Luminiphilus syltensis NOR5-1B]|uniref:Lysyl-tRNA synthetase n=2 Tax=Luminiphilus TaxID=1341118 RepID=B8KUQ5_9GAMM|nr:lysyl-tRNA synthetase [Luminiphilus syltensis NOR5-1B]
MEVETPLLASAGVTDPALEPIRVPCADGERFLQTSPEYAMKRLLAAGSGDIFQICKAFRAAEVGRRHNPEYTLLEWYRTGIDHYQLLREVAELLLTLLPHQRWQVWPYATLFEELLAINPFDAEVAVLETIAREQCGEVPPALSRDGWLDLLMSHCIEPAISTWGIVFVVDYPPSQASLARILPRGECCATAARFECYVDGVELANGYWEETDAVELKRRFDDDNARLTAAGQPARCLDPRFMAAMASGLPDCAGVALGLDRLLACQLGTRNLSGILAFDWHRS